MAKIVITNYSYMEHPIGSVVDLGDIKNNSLVGMGRADWCVDPKTPKKQSKPVTTEETPVESGKLIENELKEQVAKEKKKATKTSFWDKLK